MSLHNDEVIDAITLSAGVHNEKRNGMQRAFSILLFSVFVVVDLLALVAGTSAYGSLTSIQQTNDSRITALGPIASSIRANDMQDSVRKSNDAPESPALVLVSSDISGTYETRIYLYKGQIRQEYALEGSPYTPEKSTVLADSSIFEFTYKDGVLMITTDAGVSKIALRNRQGGA